MRYELRDENGIVINTIVLDDDAHWPVPTGCTLRALADPVPINSKILSRLEFLHRFTAEERVAIRQASTTDPIIYDFLDLLYQAQEVRADDADTRAGLQYLETKGLLASGRATEILTGHGTQV